MLWFEKKKRLTNHFGLGKKKVFILFHTVDGRNPAPVDRLSHYFTRFYTSQVVQDFFHQQSGNDLGNLFLRLEISQTLKETQLTRKTRGTPRLDVVGSLIYFSFVEGAGMRGLLGGWAPKDL